jgi:hypothetical protein
MWPARILRGVLMKPEAESYVRELHNRVEQLAYLGHAP